METPLNFAGRVIWTDHSRTAGLAFIDVQAHHRNELERWIESEFNAAVA
jgi:hypothetical protein